MQQRAVLPPIADRELRGAADPASARRARPNQPANMLTGKLPRSASLLGVAWRPQTGTGEQTIRLGITSPGQDRSSQAGSSGLLNPAPAPFPRLCKWILNGYHGV